MARLLKRRLPIKAKTESTNCSRKVLAGFEGSEWSNIKHTATRSPLYEATLQLLWNLHHSDFFDN